jgi:hypothetical protein
LRAQSQSNKDIIQEFRFLAEGVASYYQRFQIAVKPYRDPALPHFSGLAIEKQQNALHYMRQIWGMTQNYIENQVDAGNDEIALWNALKVYGLTPKGNLFNHLEADDKIEIYTLDGVQIWRNFNVMAICSYTLEESHSFEWQERYGRSSADNLAIMSAIEKIFQPGEECYVLAKIPYHLVVEKFSEEKLHLNVRHDYFFPLTKKDKSIAAFLVTSKVDILSKNARLPVQEKVHLGLVHEV